MDKIGRILLVGVVAGLLISALGTATHLVLTPLTAGVTGLRAITFQTVLVGFLFDLGLGFLFVLAYAVVRRAVTGAAWKRVLLFWVVLLAAGAAPRAACLYRSFLLPDRLVLALSIAAAVEMLAVAVVVVLLYPGPKCPPRAGAAKE